MQPVDGLLDRKSIEDAPTKPTPPYDVAEEMFVSENKQAAKQALMSGQIKVEGDMTKLMAIQQNRVPASPLWFAAVTRTGNGPS